MRTCGLWNDEAVANENSKTLNSIVIIIIMKYESFSGPSKSACAAIKIPNTKRCAKKKKKEDFSIKSKIREALAYTGKCNFITICFHSHPYSEHFDVGAMVEEMKRGLFPRLL